MKKNILRTAIAAPVIAATLTVPVAAFAAPAADDDTTITIPGADDVDLSDIGESTYEVTADWGDGEVITDATEGGDGTGDGEGDPVEPQTKDDASDEEKSDEKSEDEVEPTEPSEDASEATEDESEKSEAPTVEDGSDSPAEADEDEAED